MELRRAADALLRSQTSPLAAFLFPATNVRWMTNAQLGYRGCSNRQIQRSFTSGVQRNAIRPSATTTAAPPPSTEASISESDPTEPQPALEEQAKSLGWTARPRGYAVPTLSREREKALNGGSSADDLMAMLKQRRSPSTMDVTRMRDTKLLQQSGGFGLSQSFNNEMGVYKPPRKPILLNPSTGRSVTVGTGIDVAKGFRLMEMSCARNKVRTDAMRQRFHERGGLKRKRLRRERWRVRFLEGFKATVSRVKQLKHQGW
ncbi:hypothetical protein BKA65DRAFT_516609 [Rhexocercosporidium sp. MPI-PUGE-AT-0058]|nr:hypothetical protein BKA65DRAFT_516609 [Rhexocercosporidium sp. MPI-PUGE-AT-0058]